MFKIQNSKRVLHHIWFDGLSLVADRMKKRGICFNRPLDFARGDDFPYNKLPLN